MLSNLYLSKHPFKILFLVLLSVFLILAGILIISRYNENRRLAEQAEYEQLVSDVNKLTFAKQYDQATEKLTSFITKSSNKEHQYVAMNQLGTVYLQQGKYQEALDWFQKADQIGIENDPASSLGIAMAAEALGEKPTAINAYQKAIAILQKNDADPFTAEDIKNYENQIKILEDTE
jgi:tetratricopeptide (TPR) repeat protein